MGPIKDDDVVVEFRGKFIAHAGHCGRGFRVLGTSVTADVCSSGTELTGSEVSPRGSDVIRLFKDALPRSDRNGARSCLQESPNSTLPDRNMFKS